MATVKLLTVFSTKIHQNCINMNYSIFHRPNNIMNSLYSLQSKDYVRGNNSQGNKCLFVDEMQTVNKLCDSFNRKIFLTPTNDDKCEEEESSSEKLSEKLSEKSKNIKKMALKADEAKKKASNFLYKFIAYFIYAFDVVLDSNELKLMKQLAIKGFCWWADLYHKHVLQNPNIKDALSEIKQKMGRK